MRSRWRRRSPGRSIRPARWPCCGRLPGRLGRSGLTVGSIVAAAVGLADAEGLDAVSMRRVAEQRRRRHDDAVHARPGPRRAHRPHGRHRGRRTSTRTSTPLPAHRAAGAVRCGSSRGSTGACTSATPGCSTSRTCGRSSARTRSASTRPSCARSRARGSRTSRWTRCSRSCSPTSPARRGRGSPTSGCACTPGWTTRSGGTSTPRCSTRLLDPGAYPVASRVGTASSTQYQGAADPLHALEFGLDRILDGVAALVGARRAPDVTNLRRGCRKLRGRLRHLHDSARRACGGRLHDSDAQQHPARQHRPGPAA